MYNYDQFNVKDYGATGNGSTDDTASINTTIAALNANGGGSLIFPYGTYLVSSSLTTITVPCEICGHGQQVSIISYSGATGNVLSINAIRGPKIHDFGIMATSNRTSGDGIYIQGSSLTGLCENPEVYATQLEGHQHAITLYNCFDANISYVYMNNNIYGVYINAPQFSDQGAGQIYGCFFSSSRTDGAAAIFQLNNGGLHIIGNSSYGGGDMSYFYLLQLANGTVTSDITVSDNFIDALGIAGISLQGPSSSGSLTNIAITGNTLTQLGFTELNMLEVKGGPAGWLGQFAITGNVFQYNEAAVTSGIGISLVNATSGLIAANSFLGVNANATAININSSCSNVIIGEDQLFNNNGTSVVNNQTFPSVLSAFSIALPQIGNVVKVVGTTSVSFITGGWSQRRITLLIPNGVLFTTSGNIASSVNAAAGTQVLAVFDGTKWYLK